MGRSRGARTVVLAVGVLLVVLVAGLAACGERSGRGPSAGGGAPQSDGLVVRYLVGGWVVPHPPDGRSKPSSETLKTAVITSQEELTAFLERFEILFYRGNAQSLDNVEFAEDVVVAAYYLWRPLKGDPLSVRGVSVRGAAVEVDLELEADPQGRERPYLMAPLQMVALDREDLGPAGAREFLFRVNGEASATETALLP
ncbi:MAG: hypothetical protein J4F43_09320 [Dehalococcoidia bacterium]|nr:hypothetical protein [Dehalococcoidia bacterium]